MESLSYAVRWAAPGAPQRSPSALPAASIRTATTGRPLLSRRMALALPGTAVAPDASASKEKAMDKEGISRARMNRCGVSLPAAAATLHHSQVSRSPGQLAMLAPLRLRKRSAASHSAGVCMRPSLKFWASHCMLPAAFSAKAAGTSMLP